MDASIPPFGETSEWQPYGYGKRYSGTSNDIHLSRRGAPRVSPPPLQVDYGDMYVTCRCYGEQLGSTCIRSDYHASSMSTMNL